MKRTKRTLKKELKKEDIELSDEVLTRISTSVSYQHASFEEKLRSFLELFDVPFDQEDIDLLGLRNKIIHSGKFPTEYNSRLIIPHKEADRLIYFIDRILLSIFGYRDKTFLNIFDQYHEETLESLRK
ncbi:hypothetical protein HNV12_24565 [Methanococcoides sp. SA1]|nr:hypothetical protein [Methanococcoides sp. SA1]